uniref:Hydroxycarboxylic acid receptor 1 n=1 Tax=Amphilophus citrinellus TaxID=61819 RepID=A0A3Q0QVZ4_AMPCI
MQYNLEDILSVIASFFFSMTKSPNAQLMHNMISWPWVKGPVFLIFMDLRFCCLIFCDPSVWFLIFCFHLSMQQGSTQLKMHCSFNGTLLISVLPPLLMTEFILGVIGNGLALWIFCFHLRPWKSSTVLLFNLAMADFLLNIVLPLRATYYMSGIKWKFGSTFCNICLFMLALNRSGSTFFLMAIALDRYMRVVHPHHPINSLSVSKAIIGALGLWLVTTSMTAHVFSLAHDNTTFCESFTVDTKSHGNLSWHKFAFLFSFYMPLLVILYCTFCIVSRLRRTQLAQHAKIKKALYFIIVVVVLFIICFLPSNITQLLIWNLTVVFYITISLTYLNSALDPVVYYFSSPLFKNICRKALHLPQTETAESTEKKTRETASQSISQL